MTRPHCSAETRPAGAPALIGRDREMRQFTMLAGAITPGRPAVVVLDGPPGSGRSRMLAEFAAAGRRSAMTVVPEPEWTSAAGARRLVRAVDGRPDPLLLLCDHPQRVDPRAWTVLEPLAESRPVLVAVTALLQQVDEEAPTVHDVRLAGKRAPRDRHVEPVALDHLPRPGK